QAQGRSVPLVVGARLFSVLAPVGTRGRTPLPTEVAGNPRWCVGLVSSMSSRGRQARPHPGGDRRKSILQELYRFGRRQKLSLPNGRAQHEILDTTTFSGDTESGRSTTENRG